MNYQKKFLWISKIEINEILNFIRLQGDNQSILSTLENMFSDNEISLNGIKTLKDIVSAFNYQGIPEKCLKIDLSIARGLDYYTGCVFERMP